MDAKRLLDQLTGAGNGDVRVRQGQEQNLGSLLQGLAGARGGGGLGSLLGGLTGGGASGGAPGGEGRRATPGMGAPAVSGSAGGHGGTPMGGAMGGSRSSYGDPADRVGDNRNMAGTGGGGDIGSMLSGALGPGGLLSGGAGKGALAAGLIGMLMKSGKPKRMMSSGLKLGGLALIGGLAYKAYQDYQAGQRDGQQSEQPQGAIEPPPADSAFAPSSPQEEQDHARAIIRAMVGAAKADGHVDADEQERLFGAIDTLDLDNDDKAFLMDELRGHADAAAVAREARTPELAAEIYVASLLVIDEVDPQERRYLDDLAGAMRMEPGLARRLEAQVAAAQEA